MYIFFYDQTFEGLLTAVFDAYKQKHFPDQILASEAILPLLTTKAITIQTDAHKAARVWRALQKKITPLARKKILYTWLSDAVDKDTLLFNCICKFVDNPAHIENNMNDPDMLTLHQVTQQVNKERLHLMQFVRFQKTVDGIYFAPVNPAHNALPLAIAHFKDRFADQQWIIYDMVRRYGYFYNLQTVTEITLDWEQHFEQEQLKKTALAQDEQLIETLWQKYFKALTIKERLNLKVQKQHMPTRFWKYLTEKRPVH